MGKRKTNTNSQVESVKSNKKECISNPNEQPHQALSALQTQNQMTRQEQELSRSRSTLEADDLKTELAFRWVHIWPRTYFSKYIPFYTLFKYF